MSERMTCFGLLLDLAGIEEAQISVQGRRGGGISRGAYGPNSFQGYRNLLFAPKGQPAGSSHSRVIETSSYQAPPEAILPGYLNADCGSDKISVTVGSIKRVLDFSGNGD